MNEFKNRNKKNNDSSNNNSSSSKKNNQLVVELPKIKINKQNESLVNPIYEKALKLLSKQLNTNDN
jgi:hypothetical protein